MGVGVDEDLLDLVAGDHREADDPAVDVGDRRVGDPRWRPLAKALERAGRSETVRHVARMGGVPGAVPDVGDGGHVLGVGGSELHRLTLGLSP